MKNKRLLSNFFLFMTAFIWGIAFVSQRKGMEAVGPFTFVASRYFLSSVFLYILLFMRKKKTAEEKQSEDKHLVIKASLCCGFCLTCGALLQQFGLVFTTAGKAAFITTMYILLLPVIGIFFGKKCTKQTSFSVVLGAVGLYLLTMKEGFTIQRGDFVILIGAFFWAFHILSVDHFLSKGVDPLKLSFGQMLVIFSVSFVFTFLFEKPSIDGLKEAAIPIIYSGIFSGGLGFTFQILGQKDAEPVVASIIMSLEAAFGAIAGAILLHEKMLPKELLGSILLFSAVILSQIKLKKEDKKTSA